MSLLKRKKQKSLTPEEEVGKQNFVKEYIGGYRRSVHHHIEVVVVKGNDVTPEKLRQVQREKGLHGRSLEWSESVITINKGLELKPLVLKM